MELKQYKVTIQINLYVDSLDEDKAKDEAINLTNELLEVSSCYGGLPPLVVEVKEL